MALSVVLAGLIIPNIMNIAFRKKLFDDVNGRKIHHGAVPRLGGISFLPAFMFAFCAVTGFSIRLHLPGMEKVVGEDLLPVFFLFCALMLMYLVGMADDLVGVRYRAKFLFQILAGVMLIFTGIWIRNLYGFCGVYEWASWLGCVAAIFIVVYVSNAINLIDGIDGLASGLSMIALAFYSYLFLNNGQFIYGMMAGGMLGTLFPFFYFNVFGSPERRTKIFMGDTGALTIGVLLAFFTIEVFNLPLEGAVMKENPFVLALAPILLPCFDVARVFLHRVRRGRNPFMPDKCHIHHKLLALGMKQTWALVLILGMDAGFIIFNMVVSPYINPTWVLLIDLAIWTAINIGITALIRSREKRIGSVLYE